MNPLIHETVLSLQNTTSIFLNPLELNQRRIMGDETKETVS